MAGLSVAVALGCGRGLRGGNSGAWGRERGGGAEVGGFRRRDGGMVRAPGGGGLRVRLWSIWALSSTWSCPDPLRPFPRSRVCWETLGLTGEGL